MRKIFDFIRGSKIINKIDDIGLIVSLGLYTFSIPAFSGLRPLVVITYACMALLIFFVVFKYIFYKKFFFDRRLLILFAFAIEAFVGTLFHSHDFVHWRTIVLLFVSFVVIYYGLNAIDNKRLIFKIVAFAFLTFGAVFVVYYRKDFLKLNFDAALGRDFDNVNTIGSYFSIGSILFLYLGLTYVKKIEWLYYLPCVIMAGLGLFTGSRHFILTTGIGLSATLIIGFKKRKWIALIIIASIIITFILAIQMPFLAKLKEKIDRGITTYFGIGDAKYDPSVIQRTIWPLYGFNLGSKELLFGYGAEGFKYYSSVGTYSHNNYSEIICNFGIIGGLIFYFALLYPFVLALRSRDRSINIVLIITIFYFVKGFFGVFYSSKDAYIMLALLFYLTKDLKLGAFMALKHPKFRRKKQRCEVQI